MHVAFPESRRKAYSHFHAAIGADLGGKLQTSNAQKEKERKRENTRKKRKRGRKREKDRQATPAASQSPNHSLNVHKQVSTGWQPRVVI